MSAAPFSSFIILGAMRSGSNLLETFLNQYNKLVCHGELFQKAFIGVQGRQEFLGIDLQARNENPQRLLDAVRARNPKKITGFRFFQGHDARVLDTALKDPHCAKIILTRDPIDSFVSLKIALETKQWLVSDVAHRRTAQIRFDLDEYDKYLEERAQFYDKVSDALALLEQPFFKIDYSALHDVDNINRLAAFIGDKQKKAALNQPIKRQNPEPLSQKIINIKEVRAVLGAPNLFDNHPPILKPVVETETDLSRAYICPKTPLIFGPIPSGPDLGPRRWMEVQCKASPEKGFSAHRFLEWQARHTDTAFFSVVRHPVSRAYNAFMHKIFATVSGAYLAIRQDLENQFGMFLPQGEISATQDKGVLVENGYGLEEHRISFKLFLVFVAANLANETKIRQDGKWQLQAEILRRYRILHPEVIVIKEENMKVGWYYLENRLDLPPIPTWRNAPDIAYAFPLPEVYDAEVEALAKVAYGRDYEELGYESWA